MENKAAVSLCLYYKGEDECPFPLDDKKSTYWGLEQSWVKLVIDNEEKQDSLLVPFLLDFGSGLDGFDIEISLKATMYDQFVKFGGSKGDFPLFLLDYLSVKN